MKRLMRFVTGLGVVLLVSVGAPVLAEEGASAAGGRFSWYASIDGVRLPVDEYGRRLIEAGRMRFFHGRIPDNQFESFRREIADQLIDEYLLAREAERRGVAVDEAEIEQRWASFDDANSAVEGWDEARERFEPVLKASWRREMLAARLREQVRSAVKATEADVRQYYESHPELFTEPAAHVVSYLLLAVDPGAPEEQWQQAMAKAAELRQQVLDGADFAELARQFSSHHSAGQGGDLGVVHRGMMADEVEAVIERLGPGEISEPIRVLEGAALVMVRERIPEKHHPFEKVRQRAEGLWLREQRELAESSLVFELRQQADIELNLEVILPDPKQR